MKKAEIDEIVIVTGGVRSRSYGAGMVCGVAVVATGVGFLIGGPMGIAMLITTGSVCSGGIAIAWND